MEIQGFSNYLIYPDGRVWTRYQRKFRKPARQKLGYDTIILTDNGKRKTYLIHRLVAIHYIPNPDNCLEVDHIDRVRSNNDISNLRWVTHTENQQNLN